MNDTGPAAAEQKLLEEEKAMLKQIPENCRESAKYQFDLLIGEIISHTYKDQLFAAQVLRPLKSFEKCYEYLEMRAREMSPADATSCAVDSVMLMKWIFDYYAQKEDVVTGVHRKKEKNTVDGQLELFPMTA